MKRLSAVILLSLSAAAYSGDEEAKFSVHDPALKYESVNKYGAYVFAGDIEVTGTLIFTFDLDDPEHAVDVMYARFVPDSASLKRLPSVTAGPHPGAIEYISLESANDALVSIFGQKEGERLKHGKGDEVRVSVSVRLKNLLTGIECDSRTYWSTVFTVNRVDGMLDVATESPHGC